MSGKRLTYLCGGINGLSDSECKDWRERAKELLTMGTLDPMRRDYRGVEGDNYFAIVTGDLSDIQDSDYFLVNATVPSWGTAMEIVYAYKLHRKIVAFVGDSRVSPWLKFHCNHVVKTLEEATDLLNKEAK
jgi:nucleoside 2-deoxyribosyltransferase